MNIDVEDLTNDLKTKFSEKCKNKEFNEVAKKLDVTDLYLNIAEIEQVVSEQNNCQNCSSYETCENVIKGHLYQLYEANGKIAEKYVKCEKLAELDYLRNIYLYGKKQSDIEVHEKFYRDPSRTDVMKYISEIINNNDLSSKGIYLYGSFGTGKSYIMNVFVKKMAQLQYQCGIVYYPELLLQIRNSMSSQIEVLEKIKNLDVLVIDDIGAEKLTTWSRDEVLGTILQHRMENKLFTCFTSNYSIEQLIKHLSSDREVVSANRIADRIKFLTKQFKIVSDNYRE